MATNNCVRLKIVAKTGPLKDKYHYKDYFCIGLDAAYNLARKEYEVDQWDIFTDSEREITDEEQKALIFEAQLARFCPNCD